MTMMQANTDHLGREPWVHAAARESRAVLRIVVAVLMLATVVTMITLPFWGIFPAILLLGAYALLWIANIAEHRSRQIERVQSAPVTDDMPGVDADETEAEAHAQPRHAEKPAAWEDIPVSTLLKESITVAEIIVGFAVAAVIVAALFFHWSMLAIATLFIFPYMLILLAPVWLGGFTKELERERMREQLDH